AGGDLCQRPRCWYFRGGHGLFGKDLVVNGENKYHAILGNGGPAYFVSPSSLGPGPLAPPAKGTPGSSERKRGRGGGEIFCHAGRGICPRNSSAAKRAFDRDHHPAQWLEERDLRSPAEGGARLASRRSGCLIEDEGELGRKRACGSRRGSADAVAGPCSQSGA